MTDYFYDYLSNRLLLDVERPFMTAATKMAVDETTVTDVELNPERPLQMLMMYGVWNDEKDTDGGKTRGDRNMDQI